MFFIFDKVKDMAKIFQDDIGSVLYIDGKTVDIYEFMGW
ncbi:ABC transporter ATP-binding protein [Bacillus pseudomycoides]|nr:hypothetical protein bmyco0002_50750 [Bacillus pseudomycoides]EEM08260.1 hypothetical protein bmyco0003_50310 [Bacillus pseudomycoides]